MGKDWASTFVEIVTKPVSLVTDAIDTLVGTPEHERFSNSVKSSVFKESHLRNVDKVSDDNSLRAGFILRVSRMAYWHYGVYVGNDRVVHFTSNDGDTSTNNVVMETSTKRFIRDASMIEILGFPDKVEGKPIYSREETCKRARSKIGAGDYSLFNNNCQHFAIWCKTGVAYSGQTYLVNGGKSNSYGSAALGGVVPDALAPDFLSELGISVSRAIFASNYSPK